MAVVASAARTRRPLSVAPRFRAWHPEWWVYAAAAVTWLSLLVAELWDLRAGSPAGQHAHHDGMVMAAGSDGFTADWAMAWGHWVLMVVAMMLLVVAPQVRTVAVRSLWSRRQRSAAVFLVGYLAAWLVAGALLIAVLAAAEVLPLGAPWLVGTLVVAAVWQVSRQRRRVLRRCGSLRLGPASGFAADRNCAWVGVRSGGRCLVTCGPLMLPMLASHDLVLMVALLLVLLSERSRGPDPLGRIGRPLEAWAIGGIAVVAGLAAAIAH